MDRLHLLEGVMNATHAAQRSRVVRRPRAADGERCSSALQRARAVGAACGRVRKDAQARKLTDEALPAAWTTTYLHTGGAYKRDALLAELVAAMVRMAFEADAAEGWGLLAGRQLGEDANVRNVELHEYAQHGRLPHVHHNDTGSLVTVDLLLADGFTGGRFCTLEPEDETRRHDLELGDAVVFQSHKYHHVEPVESGARAVIVVEIWTGPERECAHRCTQGQGACAWGRA